MLEEKTFYSKHLPFLNYVKFGPGRKTMQKRTLLDRFWIVFRSFLDRLSIIIFDDKDIAMFN